MMAAINRDDAKLDRALGLKINTLTLRERQDLCVAQGRRLLGHDEAVASGFRDAEIADYFEDRRTP